MYQGNSTAELCGNVTSTQKILRLKGNISVHMTITGLRQNEVSEDSRLTFSAYRGPPDGERQILVAVITDEMVKKRCMNSRTERCTKAIHQSPAQRGF